jgi:hypothetical protein
MGVRIGGGGGGARAPKEGGSRSRCFLVGEVERWYVFCIETQVVVRGRTIAPMVWNVCSASRELWALDDLGEDNLVWSQIN